MTKKRLPKNCISMPNANLLAVLVSLVVVSGLATPLVRAQTFTVLYNFTPYTGAWPYGTLVRDSSGNLYGTTYQGGTSLLGEVFEVSPSGTETTLYSFTGSNDGYWPFAGVTRTGNGIIYGTTYYGGGSGCSGAGCGTVFKLVNGETVLHSFTGGSADGCNPYGGVVRDKSGNLYGTTYQCGSSGYGTVWKLNTTGKETVLHSFTGGATDGSYPGLGGLIIDAAGNLYGSTSQGGAHNGGTVFKLDTTGKETVLHSFRGTPGHGDPDGTLARDKYGNLYGTTTDDPYGYGSVWKLSQTGKFTLLYSFKGGPTDGDFPLAGVIRDGEGNFYGVTYYGGSSGEGIVFKLSKGGVMTVLHSFSCASDGCYPIGGVIRDAAGNLYGTAYYGGNPGPYGTVWKLVP
jgi:uncharacterized repeat protein (TIGR03803 family)